MYEFQSLKSEGLMIVFRVYGNSSSWKECILLNGGGGGGGVGGLGGGGLGGGGVGGGGGGGWGGI